MLETDFDTADGAVRVIDFMPLRSRSRCPTSCASSRGLEGRVPMRMELRLRFDYGAIVPWVRRRRRPDARDRRARRGARCAAGRRLRGEDLSTVADFTSPRASDVAVRPDLVSLATSRRRCRSTPMPRRRGHRGLVAGLERRAARYPGPVARRRAALADHAQGADLRARPAASSRPPTTSLPEQLGGVRNWDYRYCWLRDATLTLRALLAAGYTEEAGAWRDWLLRAVAGEPAELQIMYGVARRAPAHRVRARLAAGLRGLEAGAGRQRRVRAVPARRLRRGHGRPVRGARGRARARPTTPGTSSGRCSRFLETNWSQPDEGIWEVRGPRRHFTHSKVMAWVAFDRAVKSVEEFGLDGPVERWKRRRDEIHARGLRARLRPGAHARSPSPTARRRSTPRCC